MADTVMNKQTEALKMSQKLLRRLMLTFPYDVELAETLTAIHKALEQEEESMAVIVALQKHISELKFAGAKIEQPAQEPVMWWNETMGLDGVEWNKESGLVPLYTHPAPNKVLNKNTPDKVWQGLSDDEIKSFGKDFFDIDICLTGNLMNFARNIEQALKEKNHG